MRSILFALVIYLWPHFGIAEPHSVILDPELDYVTTSDALCAKLGIMKKDTFRRLDLDISGDGRDTIFLAFNGSRSGMDWTAYVPQDRGGFARIDNIQFRENFFRAGKVPDLNPSGGLLVLYPGKGAGNLVRYPFDGERIQQQEELRKLDYNKSQDRQLFERIFDRQLDEQMPNEYAAKPPHKVIDVKETMDRIRTPRHEGRLTKRPPIVDTIPASPAVVPPQKSNVVEVKPALHVMHPLSDRKTVRWPWIIGAILLLTVLSGVWLFWGWPENHH